MISNHTKESLERYVNHRIQPGGFLTAVLSNDLFGAVGSADSFSRVALADICQYIYNEVPGNAWGSRDAVRNYLKGQSE